MAKGRNARAALTAAAAAAAAVAASASSDEGDNVGATHLAGASAISGDDEVAFAKLQGEDFVYFMQTYSIVLGRGSKNSDVDVDLAALGGGMSISRRHARIFYDFPRKRFALEVIGKNGCLVEGVLYEAGAPPIKLDSQDLLQIGDKQFYFLLPRRSIFGPSIKPVVRGGAVVAHSRNGAGPSEYQNEHNDDDDEEEEDEEVEAEEEDEEDAEEEVEHDVGVNRSRKVLEEDRFARATKAAPLVRGVKKSEARTKADREADDHQLLQLEEKDVISSAASVLSEIYGPGTWVPMDKLHAELFKRYSNVWHHSRVRKYLTLEDYPKKKGGVPWIGLAMLLRKYPEHFSVNVSKKGRTTMELVSLVA